MGIGGISVWQLLIVLAIIVLLFGTKKFSNVGADLGKAVKGFKKAISDTDELAQVEVVRSTDANPDTPRSDNR